MAKRRPTFMIVTAALIALFLVANLVQADPSSTVVTTTLLAPGTGHVNYQGVLTDAAGSPMPDGSYSVTLTLYDAATDGTSLWTETQTVSTANGLFNLQLGSVTALDPGLTDGQDLWLAVKVGQDPEMSPRLPITSVFYARSLVPGAVVRGAVNNGEILTVENTGTFGSTALKVAGRNVSSLAVDARGEIEATGDIESDRTMRAGANVEADGNVTAGADVQANRDVLAGRHVEANGNVNANGGNVFGQNVNSNGFVTARFDVEADRDVKADRDVLAGRHVEAAGNVTAAGGNLITANNVLANALVRAGSDVEADRDVKAGRDVIADGKVQAGTDVEAGRNVTAENAFFARNGNVSGVAVFARGGDVSANQDVRANVDVEAGRDVNAGRNVTAGGTKSARIQTASFGQRLTYAVEGAQVWLVDQGQGQLQKGVATITLDPIFLETVTIDEQHPMLVHITLTSDSKGVYVAEQTATSFTVRELQGGTSDATFNWQVSVLRKGYEDTR
ncbi:MAG: hypothetical protein ACE5LU_21610, partial [Anaerolineae bacterium]